MPSNIPATTIRIDPEVKREAAAILDELGLSMSTAVNAFLRALVREGGMPFEMRVKTPAPDGETARQPAGRHVNPGLTEPFLLGSGGIDDAGRIGNRDYDDHA